MDLATITVSDFKALFKKDFPFLPEWKSSPQFYNTSEIVYFSPTRLFYKAKANQIYDIPTDTTVWETTTGDADDYIDDCAIERAFMEAKAAFNLDIWTDDCQGRLAYLYLTAFYLVQDTLTALGGIAGGSTGLMTSRTVGNVSESYQIPQRYLNNPTFAYYAKNGYGVKYLSFIISRGAGLGFTAVCGRTLP